MSVATPEAPRAELAPPAAVAPLPARRRARANRPAAALALAALALMAYAAFAGGGISIPDESRLQIGIAAVSAAALAGLLFAARRPHAAPTLRAAAPPAGWAGLALLGLFAVWNGISLAWSIAPENSWLDFNRMIGYALVAGLGLVIGASLPRAAERMALGFVALAAVVALYALGGKALPSLDLLGLVDLNHTADFSRLRAPFGYWNALGLFCVLAVPIALRAAADLERNRTTRILSELTLVPLLVTIGLTYSRGALLALLFAVALLVALSPDRLRLLAFAGAAVLGAAPALVLGFTSDPLTTDAVPVAERTDEGIAFLIALVAGVVLAAAAGWALRRWDEWVVMTARARRTAWRVTWIAGAVLSLGLLGAMNDSERGVGGTIEHQFDQFTETKAEKTNDPGRILKTNSGNRWTWWEEAAGAWSDRPLAGHGAGSFQLLHLQYRENTLPVRDAHSVPLQFLAETGVIGALLALGGLALLAAAAVRRLWRGPAGQRPYVTALAAAISAYAVHMWFDWDWDVPAVTLPALLFLGILAARPPGAGGSEVRPLAPGREPGGRVGMLALGVAMCCAFALSALLPALARDRTSSAFEHAAAGTPEELAAGARDAEIARRLNPLSDDPTAAASAIAERRGRYDRAAQLLAEGVDRAPSDPQAWLRVATFNFRRDDLRAALPAAQRLAELDPRGESALLFLPALDPSVRSATATGTPLPRLVPPPPAPAPAAPAPPSAASPE
ncbi:MAG: O-antigen ligase family protein [Thermoleophilaceae bacterium]